MVAGVAAVAVACAWAGVRGGRLLMRGVRCGEDPSAPLRVIRDLRGIIVAICAMAIAGGIVFEHLWLAEEIYETGVLALILRAGQRR